jgi:hypothetical protein
MRMRCPLGAIFSFPLHRSLRVTPKGEDKAKTVHKSSTAIEDVK